MFLQRFAPSLLALVLPTLPAAEPPLSLSAGGASFELRLVEPGTFTQGSPASEPGRSADETPRQVTLTKPFYMTVTPVTVGQFRAFTGETGYRTEAEVGTSGGFGWNGSQLAQERRFTWKSPGFAQTDAHPVTIVTWNDAKAFCGWLSKKTNRLFTLPTEAQWEYACRAGTTSAWPTGGDAAAADAWAWHRGQGLSGTHPVGQKAANAWGFQDMGGNVWEWCEDWFGPYAAGPVTDPFVFSPPGGDKARRVLRGGSWLKDAAVTRSAARFRNDPQSRNADNGFRVVTLTLVAAAPAPPTPAPRPRAETPGAPPVPSAPVSSPTVPAPSHSAPAARKSLSLPGLVCPVGVLALVGIVFVIIRKVGARRMPVAHVEAMPATTGGGSVRTVVTDDGFWLQATVPAGTPIRWSCSTGDRELDGTVAYEPGPQGHFIFVGKRPMVVSAEVAATSARTTVQPQPPPFSRGFAAGNIMHGLDRDRERRDAEEEDRRRRSRSHYPSAY